MSDKVNAAILHQAMITPIYYRMGTFENNNGKIKYVKAPFKLITMQGNNDGAPYELYLMPEPLNDLADQVHGTDLLLSSDTFDEDQWMGREDFGWHCGDWVVLDGPNAMGSYTTDTDNWRGLHEFGMI